MISLTRVGKPDQSLYHSRENVQEFSFPSDGWRFQKPRTFPEGQKEFQDRECYSEFLSQDIIRRNIVSANEGVASLRLADLGDSVEIIFLFSSDEYLEKRHQNFWRRRWCILSRGRYRVQKMPKTAWQHHQWGQRKVTLVDFWPPIVKVYSVLPGSSRWRITSRKD